MRGQILNFCEFNIVFILAENFLLFSSLLSMEMQKIPKKIENTKQSPKNFLFLCSFIFRCLGVVVLGSCSYDLKQKTKKNLKIIKNHQKISYFFRFLCGVWGPLGLGPCDPTRRPIKRIFWHDDFRSKGLSFISGLSKCISCYDEIFLNTYRMACGLG